VTVSAATFRQSFLEFADLERYPNGLIDYWISVAVLSVNAQRFGRLTDHGVSLFTAHEVSLARRAQDEADNGGVPGEAIGPVNNKSVDKVSIGFDTAAASLDQAGHWALTQYGQKFLKLSRQCGAGPLMIGVPGACTPGFGPWPGPWTGLFPNMNQ